MIDMERAKKAFEKYTESTKSEKDITGYLLKKDHIYHVMERAGMLAEKLGLSNEDVELARLIGLLHDIGRFEELLKIRSFNTVDYDHAKEGVKLLFENNLIREFIEDTKFDYIIEKAIYNHNKMTIEDGLDDRTLLHAKIIRDSDKLDNFRVKLQYRPEQIFINDVSGREAFENSAISENVYNAVRNKQCANTADRKLPLDFFVVILGFMYDLYFRESYEIVKENDYINRLIDKFEYKNSESKEQMEKIRQDLIEYVDIKSAKIERKTIEHDEAYLRQVSKEVVFPDKDLKEEIAMLENFCKETACFALAAVQIGIPKRIVYLKNTTLDHVGEKEYNEQKILINPRILSKKGKTKYWEACVSCMDNMGLVVRPYAIELEYCDVNGNKKVENLEGFESTVVSHELDHLDGILHMDVAEEVKVMPLEERRKWRKDHPYEVISKE